MCSNYEIDAAGIQVLAGAVQAMLYVLCYHMRRLQGDGAGGSGPAADRVAALVRDTLPQVCHHPIGLRVFPEP